MANSKTEIWNMALGHLGAANLIGSPDENSTEAKICRIFWQEALNQVISDYQWPFAKKRASLALIKENPNVEWGYSYRYPGDCIKILRLYYVPTTNAYPNPTAENFGPYDSDAEAAALAFNGEPTQVGELTIWKVDQTHIRIPMDIIADPDASGSFLVFSNYPMLAAEYLFNSAPISTYPSDLVLAMSYRMAMLIGPKLAAGNEGRIKEVERLYTAGILAAQKCTIEELVETPQPESSFIRARD